MAEDQSHSGTRSANCRPKTAGAEDELVPEHHFLAQDTDLLTVAVPISAHSEEVLHARRLRLSQNEITSASGALAGFLSGLVVCPLDVAKTRLQAQGAFVGHQSAQNFAKAKYHGVVDSMHSIWAEEGFRGLYRGVVPITLGYFPTWMIYFSCYEHFKRFYGNITHDDNLTYFASAISSGAISTTLTNPIWVVKTRLMLQMDGGKTIYDRFDHGTKTSAVKRPTSQWYTGTFNAFTTMYKQEGISVFYRGLLPSYFGLVHVAIQFPLYENFKSLFGVAEDGGSQMGKFIAASCLSKGIASAVTYPHELVRTRMQLGTTNTESQMKILVKVVKAIVRAEGFAGFYSGFVVNLARTVPASAVTLVSFEYFKRFLQRYSVPS